MQRTYSQIDLNGRRKLARWRGMGLSVNVIAEKIGRHRSAIFREFLLRNNDRQSRPIMERLISVMRALPNRSLPAEAPRPEPAG